jgi:calcineurin-like phosphoesterase family protein
VIFFISDTHFYHKAILSLCNRSWAQNILDHNTQLIDAWNSVVTNADEVYHLGDFAYKTSRRNVENIINKLNGKKYLIHGNHERKTPKEMFVWAKDYHEFEYNNIQLVLFHYPIASWRRKYRGAIHVHGHSHGKLDLGVNTLDVGVDNIGLRPMNIDTVIEKARNKGVNNGKISE